MLIVYRKTDGKILLNTGKSFIKPMGMSDINGKLAVVERMGGSFKDYGTFRLHDVEDEEKVDEILKHEDYMKLIIKGDIVINYEINYKKREQDQLLLEEQKLIDTLIPSDRDILWAEIDLKMITILQEVDLI